MEMLFAPVLLVLSSHILWLWIATSVLLSALANGLAWRVRCPIDRTRPALIRWLLSFLREGGRFLYFVGIPYMALLGGLIPATEVGLVNGNWLRDLTISLPLGLSAFLLLLFLRMLLLWRERTAPGGVVPDMPALSLWISLRESTYQQIHWAFYRVAPLLATEDRPQAIALGLGIVALEAWLNPAWRDCWRDPGRALGALRTAGLAVTTAVIFGVTGNLWLTLGSHVAVERAAGWAWGRIGGVSGQRQVA